MSNDICFSGNWEQIKERYEQWWKGENKDGPIMHVLAPNANASNATRVADRWVASSGGGDEAVPTESPHEANLSVAEHKLNWTDSNRILDRNIAMFRDSHYCGDTFPRMYANLGPASLAAFLGAPLIFRADTVWYQELDQELEDTELTMDPDQEWLQWSINTVKKLKKWESGRYIAAMPELCEQLDVLAQLFGPQKFLMSMYECPDDVHRLLRQVQDAWLAAYDMHYEAQAREDGFCCYGPFALLGKGKVAKIQCDTSAMFSPAMFEEFALPYLDELTQKLDKTMYHLDGVEAVRHLDYVLSLEKLDALEWTPGATYPDGGDESWDFIYDKALDAGKRIYALVSPKHIERFVKRYGGAGVYIMTQATSPEMADSLVALSRQLCRR